MKRLTLILLILILVSTVLGGAIASGITQAPHENPSTAESSFNPAIPLIHYGEIFDQLASGNYPEARTLLQQLKFVEYAHLPEEIIFIMGRYNDLTTDLTGNLDNLDSMLDICEQLLSQNKLDEASTKLDETKRLVDETVKLIETISKATEELILQIAPFVSPQEATVVNEAEARLQKAMERLAELETWYKDKLKNLEFEAEEKENLLITTLTLNVIPAKAWVGNQVTISGELKATDIPLPARDVSIFLDGRHFAIITTVENGTYETSFAFPYWYISEVVAQSFYLPQGTDKSAYLASSSEIKRVTALFHSTGLSIEIPEEMYPGLPVEISGKVSSRGNVVGRNIKALLDGEPLFEITTDDHGLFKRQLMLSKGIQTGGHNLKFIVEPDDEAYSAGASIDKDLNVVRVIPQMNIHAPSVIFLPRSVRFTGELYPPSSLQSVINLTGEIHSPLALKEATLTLEMAGVSTVAVIDEEEFELGLDVPFKFNIVGYEDMQVSLAPVEPWHLPAAYEVKIFVINLVYLVIILAAFILAGVVLLMRRRGVLRKEDSLSISPEKLQTLASPTEFRLPEIKLVPGDNQGVILKAYYMAVAVVQRLARVFLKPQATLREFSSQVMPLLGKFAGLFAKLTNLAERALYSRHSFGDDEASQAQNIALQMEEQGVEETETENRNAGMLNTKKQTRKHE